jgi:ribose transport system permease protein
VPSPRARAARGPWVPLLGVALLASLVFASLNDKFLSSFNIYVILSGAALTAVIGLSQMTALSVGEFSLAVGGIAGFTGVIVGYLLTETGVPLVPALLVGLAVGALSGLANGILVAKSGVNGFVITLATGGIFTGATLAITKSQPYGDLPHVLNQFGTGRLGFVPYLLGAAVVAAVVLGALYRWRATGRTMLAVGGNAEAAEVSGLSRVRAVVWAHTLSGALAAVAGIMAMAQQHEADPNTGADWLIKSFTVAIIGGTALSGGAVSIAGVLVASVILATIDDGLVLLNVSSFWLTFVQGLLVFAAVVLGRDAVWDMARAAFRRPRAGERVTA